MSRPGREVVMNTKRRGAVRRVARRQSTAHTHKAEPPPSQMALGGRFDKARFLQEQVEALRLQIAVQNAGARNLDNHPIAYVEVRPTGFIAHANAAALA